MNIANDYDPERQHQQEGSPELRPMELCRKKLPSGRVLFIHDDGHLHQVLPLYFGKMEIQAFFADNAHDGYHVFLENSFDMVFADIEVQGGWTMACHAKKLRPALPVILIMNPPGEYPVKRLWEHSIDSFMIKPFGFFELKSKIREISAITRWERTFIYV